MARKPPKTRTITSRSLTLTTSNFCFDFTWRKVELEEPDPSPLRAPPPPPKTNDSFASLLRRKQIDELIAPRDETVPAYTLPIALGPLAPPSKGQVWRSYRQACLPERESYPDKDDYI